MKRLLTAPSQAKQAKRHKPQRFKQPPTSWWRALRRYLKRLRRATRPSSTSCQTLAKPPPHPSAPIRSLNQKISSKQQLWQRLKGPSVDSNSTLNATITPDFFQPSVNFSFRLSPAMPPSQNSFAQHRLTTLPINYPNPKVTLTSFRVTGINLLLSSLRPLTLVIHTSTPTLSILPLPESQHLQKTATLVYLPKQINYLPPLPPIMEVDRPRPPLNADWQWPANKIQVIDPDVEITYSSPKESTVEGIESEKPTQKERIKFKNFKPKKMPHILWPQQQSRKRCNFYSDSDLELAEPPKKRAKLAYDLYLDETEIPLNEPKNNSVYLSFEGANFSPIKPISAETEPEKLIRKTSSNKKVKGRNHLNIMDTFCVSRKQKNSYLKKPPKKHAKLAFNSTPSEAKTSLIEPENKGIYPFVEITNPSPKEPTVQETEPEKLTQKKPQNAKFEINYFFNILKKSKASTKLQKSRKNSDSYSGSELLESPKKHVKLAYNLCPDKAEILLNEPENDIIYPSLEKFSVTEKEPEKGTPKKIPKTVIKEAKYPKLWDISYRSKRKHHNPCSLLTLEKPPKERARLAFNSTLGEAKTSLIEPENKGIYPFVEVTNSSPKGSTVVKDTRPEKPTQKKSQGNRFKEAVFFKTSKNKYQESRKCCHLDSGSKLAEPPKKPATLASNPNFDEIGIPLIESGSKGEQSIKYDDYSVETMTEKTDSSTEKGSRSDLSNSEPPEMETAIEDAWCYRLAAYGYDTQRYPLLTQLPDDCNSGKRILRDFGPEDIFWLNLEEQSLLWGARDYYPQLAEFLQIDPLTYQHPYLEQAINAHTTTSESLPSPTQIDSCSPSDSTFKNINLTHC